MEPVRRFVSRRTLYILRLLIIVALAVTFIIACSSEEDGFTSPPSELEQSETSNTPNDFVMPGSIDEKFIELEASVPGFAGFYLDGETLEVNLVDVDVLSEAELISAILNVFGDDYFDLIFGGVTDILLGEGLTLSLNEVNFPFSELNIYRNLVNDFLAVDGVVLNDVDEVRNVVVVGLSDMSLVSDFEAQLNLYLASL